MIFTKVFNVKMFPYNLSSGAVFVSYGFFHILRCKDVISVVVLFHKSIT